MRTNAPSFGVTKLADGACYVHVTRETCINLIDLNKFSGGISSETMNNEWVGDRKGNKEETIVR